MDVAGVEVEFDAVSAGTAQGLDSPASVPIDSRHLSLGIGLRHRLIVLLCAI
jgi:hypothetical protein